MDGDKVLRKVNLRFAGRPSLFEGKTVPPADYSDLKLQVLAADQAGNFGQHTLSFRLTP